MRFDDTTNNNLIGDKNHRDGLAQRETGNKQSVENRRFRKQGVTTFKSQSRSKSPSFWVNAVAKSVRSVSPFRGTDSPSKYQVSNGDKIQESLAKNSFLRFFTIFHDFYVFYVFCVGEMWRAGLEGCFTCQFGVPKNLT